MTTSNGHSADTTTDYYRCNFCDRFAVANDDHGYCRDCIATGLAEWDTAEDRAVRDTLSDGLTAAAMLLDSEQYDADVVAELLGDDDDKGRRDVMLRRLAIADQREQITAAMLLANEVHHVYADGSAAMLLAMASRTTSARAIAAHAADHGDALAALVLVAVDSDFPAASIRSMMTDLTYTRCAEQKG